VGREVCKVKVRTSIESVSRTYVVVHTGGQAAVEITSFNDLAAPARTDAVASSRTSRSSEREEW
jgi:hypothetical protein